MSRRVLLHVGSPKTGTTFLQQVLWAQREIAREQGLLLPLRSFNEHYLATLDVRGLADRSEHARAGGIWREVVRASDAWEGDVLVSHELFAAATERQAGNAISAFGDESEVHVIITVRDLVRQIAAEWQEHLKHRSVMTFTDFVSALRNDVQGQSWFWRVQDFASIAHRWGRSLPRSHVHVVTVPPAGADPDLLWTRFAAVLKLDPGSFELTRSRSNTSLGAEQAELLRKLNADLGERLPMPGPYPRVVKNMLAHRVLAGRPGTRFGLVGEDHDFAVRRSAEIALALEKLEVSVVGDLADLVPRSSASAPSFEDALGIERPERAVLGEAVAALSGVLDEYRVQQAELASFQRRKRELDGLLAESQRERDAVTRERDAVTGERDRLVHDMRHRPLRHLFIGLSERWRGLMALRKLYWRAANSVRRRIRAMRGNSA